MSKAVAQEARAACKRRRAAGENNRICGGNGSQYRGPVLMLLASAQSPSYPGEHILRGSPHCPQDPPARTQNGVLVCWGWPKAGTGANATASSQEVLGRGQCQTKVMLRPVSRPGHDPRKPQIHETHNQSGMERARGFTSTPRPDLGRAQGAATQ